MAALASAALFAASGCGVPGAAPHASPAGSSIGSAPSLTVAAPSAAISAALDASAIAAIAELDPPADPPAEAADDPIEAAIADEAPAEPAPPPTFPTGSASPVGRGGAWRPTGTAVRPFSPEIERWRPLVRQALNDAAAEGRLWGPAMRLDDDLLLAMIQQESAGEPLAESWAGAMGLLQLMPETFAELVYGDYTLAEAIAPETFFDPALNVRAGVRYMAWALQAHRGDVYWAVSSYNAGVGATQEWRSVGLTAVPPVGGYTETAAYAPAILSNYASRRPDVAVHIPAPIAAEEIPAVVALLTAAGIW